jgi:HD-GYP domain-containing protein (c-di-GMP phosphodiesterase class II)
MQQNEHERSELKRQNNSQISVIQEKSIKIFEELKEDLKKEKKKCTDKLFEFLHSVDAMNTVTMWKSSEIPREEYGDNWVILEDKLDKAIDEKISIMLNDWETFHGVFSHVEDKITISVTEKTSELTSELEALERKLRQEQGQIDALVTEGKIPTYRLNPRAHNPLRESLTLQDKDAKVERGFDVKLGENYGYLIMAMTPDVENVLDTIQNGNFVRTTKHKKAKGKILENDGSDFFNNRVEYMRKRSERIFKSMGETPSYSEHLVETQLKQVDLFIDICKEEIDQHIESNNELLQAIASEKRKSSDINIMYKEPENKLSTLYDKVIDFGYKYVLRPNFDVEEIDKIVEPKHSSLFGDYFNGKFTDKFWRRKRLCFRNYPITLMQLRIKSSQINMIEKNLR